MKNNNRHRGAARCAFAIFELDPKAQSESIPAARDGYNEYRALCRAPAEDTRREVAVEFARLVHSHLPLTKFLEQNHLAPDASPLARFVLESICDEPEAASYFGVDDVLVSIDALRNLYGTGLAGFLRRLPTLGAITSTVASRAFDNARARLYVLVLQANGDSPPDVLLALLSRGIDQLNKEALAQELRNPTGLAELVGELAKRSIRISGEEPISDALLAYAKSIANGTVTVTPGGETWNMLLSALSPSKASEVVSGSTGAALGDDATPGGRKALLEVLERHMKTDAGVSAVADEVVKHYILELGSASRPELVWLAGALKRDISPARATVVSLQTRIGETMSTPRSATQPTSREIRALGGDTDAWLARHPLNAD